MARCRRGIGAAVLIQIGTNLYNDVGDYERGADGTDRLGPPRASSMGWLAPADVRRAAATSFGLAMVLGAYLVSVGGWPIFVIGLASVAAGVAYTGGPVRSPTPRRGILRVRVFRPGGDGRQQLPADGPILLVIPCGGAMIGALAAAVLVVNNYRDLESDRRSAKVTLAVRIGYAATRFEFAGLVLLPFAALPLLGVLTGSGTRMVLPLASLPIAVLLMRDLARAPISPALNPLLKRTARLELVFGLLICARRWRSEQRQSRVERRNHEALSLGSTCRSRGARRRHHGLRDSPWRPDRGRIRGFAGLPEVPPGRVPRRWNETFHSRMIRTLRDGLLKDAGAQWSKDAKGTPGPTKGNIDGKPYKLEDVQLVDGLVLEAALPGEEPGDRQPAVHGQAVEPLHRQWENYGQRNDWETQCATCHATGYRLLAYDPADPAAQKVTMVEQTPAASPATAPARSTGSRPRPATCSTPARRRRPSRAVCGYCHVRKENYNFKTAQGNPREDQPHPSSGRPTRPARTTGASGTRTKCSSRA